MLTPKQLRRLGDIVAQETLQSKPELSSYMEATRSNKSYQIGHIRVTASGKIEAMRPTSQKPWPARLETRAIIRTITRCAATGFELSWPTKDWLATALRAPDLRSEAEKVWKTSCQGGETDP